MIFAAGLGTRLRPLTDRCPKALVRVGGETMLSRTIRRFRESGISGIVVNVHHFAPMIKDYLAKSGEGAGVEISDESDMLLDTGGGVAGAYSLLKNEDCVVLHNADILTDFNLAEMVDEHKRSGSDVTLLAWERDSSRCFLFDGKGRLCGWKNRKSEEVKPKGLDMIGLRELAFGGVHVISGIVVDRLKEYADKHGRVFSITGFYTDMADALDIRAYAPKEKFSWFDVGSIEKLEVAEKFIQSV